MPEPAEVWMEHVGGNVSVLYLSRGAAHATHQAFGKLPSESPDSSTEIPDTARLVLDAMYPRAMGVEDVELLLAEGAS